MGLILRNDKSQTAEQIRDFFEENNMIFSQLDKSMSHLNHSCQQHSLFYLENKSDTSPNDPHILWLHLHENTYYFKIGLEHIGKLGHFCTAAVDLACIFVPAVSG
jgi:hypothetical protein